MTVTDVFQGRDVREYPWPAGPPIGVKVTQYRQTAGSAADGLPYMDFVRSGVQGHVLVTFYGVTLPISPTVDPVG
jgi:hypothetical protein